ncbi:MAG: hypothetical protein ACRBBP_00130 [Bdellovibrionales bacterium]
MIKVLPFLFATLLYTSFSFGSELAGGVETAGEGAAAVATSTAVDNSCTPAEVQENQSIVNECNSKWSEWGVNPVPPASQLRDVNNCSGLVSMGTLEGCGDALVAFPIFMAEMGARAMLATIPTDKNTLAYVSQNGSLQEIAAFLTNEFFTETCRISPVEEASYVDKMCEQSVETNAHLAASGVSQTCRAEALQEVQEAAACRSSSETRRKYRALNAELNERARTIKAAQDERKRVEEQFATDMQDIKNSCGVYMNPLRGTMTRYLAPFRYLAKEMQNIAKPRPSEVQQFNDCIERKTVGKLELREALVKSSTGLMAQIAGSFSAIKCYSERERKQLMCEIAIGVVTGGATLGPSALKMLGPKAAAGWAKLTGRAGARAPAGAPNRALRESTSPETLARNGALSDAERVAAAKESLGRGLTSHEQEQLIRSHNVGADRAGAGIGNYTQEEIREKARILNEAGFSADERRILMQEGIAGRVSIEVAKNADAAVADAIGVVSRNSDASKEMGLADVGRGMDRDEGLSFRDSGERTGAYWQRNPEQRSGVADSLRRHLDDGGVISNRQQRDEMLRIVALDTVERTTGGRVPDYERLAKYYERAGRPVDDSFVSYLTQGIPANSSHSKFMLESQIAESNMAVHRLTQQARYYADENRARGLDMTPDQGRSRANAIKAQIEAIERNRDIRQRLLDTGSVSGDVY